MNSGIGARLREARTARGIELEDAEREIKIRKRFLVAMEEERWEVLPGAAYVRGFLHTYADLLGLDPDAVVDEYRRSHRADEGAEAEPDKAPSPPVAMPEPRAAAARGPVADRVRRGPWVVVAVAVAAVLAVLLVLGVTGGSEDEGGGGAPERAAPEETAPEVAPATEEEQPPSRVKLELTATADVWVCLLDDAGEPVIEGVTIPAGESEGPFRARRFEITLGNGQVELVANGDAVDIPAPADPVGYRISPERAKELTEAERPTCA